jgi:hypothetical protein
MPWTSYRGALLNTLLHATVYMYLHNLLNVLAQTANKMGLPKEISCFCEMSVSNNAAGVPYPDWGPSHFSLVQENYSDAIIASSPILSNLLFIVIHLSDSVQFKLLTANLNIKKSWPESMRELYRPRDRRLSAKLVPNFADRRVSRSQRGGSPTTVISVF